MSRRRLGDHLTRSANWLLFRGWPRLRRGLRVLHRVALIVALVLSLLAVLVTICQQGLSDRPRDIGAEPWTTQVWAADRAGGVTIRATTGRAVPDHRPPRLLGRLLRLVLVLLAMLAVAGMGMMILMLHDGPALGSLIDGAVAPCSPPAARLTPSAVAQRQRGADGQPAPVATGGPRPSALAREGWGGGAERLAPTDRYGPGRCRWHDPGR